ncbi:hypothetical protein ACIPSA_08995 [Streptomyces sp. NPDC086549]|uniref:COG4315 family predicted lipoprotein n=1 Tax=Streptomyces sp. NPDC086549 TaxID=3365752 RepID=UPI00381AB1D6
MQRPMTPFLAALAVASCMAAAPQQHPAAAPTPPPLTVMVEYTDNLGRVLTTPDGRTLYRYDREDAGKVLCVSTCTDTHKPLLTRPGTELRLPPGIVGTLGTVSLPDGGDQVTYDGSPLYTYTADKQPGDTDGVTLHWHVIQPRNTPRAQGN